VIWARSRSVSDTSGASDLPVAAAVQPAFVLSGERAGSTLLRWLLDAHPEVASPGELRLGRLAYDLYVTLSRTSTVNEEDRVQATLREVRGALDRILTPYARARGRRVWCEKTPENLLYLEALANAYPDARYVCLHRDWRDVVNSCLEISREGFMDELAAYARRRPDNLVEAMAESWADKTTKLLEFEHRNPSLCRRVRYEDLVRNPGEVLPDVFEFLGVARESDVVGRAFSMVHDGGGGDFKIHATSGVGVDRIGAGANVRMERLSTSLRARVSSLSRRLGYAS